MGIYVYIICIYDVYTYMHMFCLFLLCGWERVIRAKTLQWDAGPTTNQTDKAAQSTKTNRGSIWAELKECRQPN